MFNYKKGGACMNIIAALLEKVGSGFADTSSKECIMLYFDEPECPKSLLK